MQRVQPAVGELAGTAAVLSVHLAFKPKLLILFNETQKSLVVHVDGMADDSALYLQDTGAGATDVLKITADGVTLTNAGFSLGVNSTLNQAADVIWYAAF